jgi:hypothetical protein
MFLLVLSRSDVIRDNDLRQIADAFQLGLGHQIEFYPQGVIIPNINGDTEWMNLVSAITLNGGEVTLVVEMNRGGSEEILYPRAQEQEATEAGVDLYDRLQKVRRKAKAGRKK